MIASTVGQIRKILAGAVNVTEFEEKTGSSDINQIAVFSKQIITYNWRKPYS